MKAFLIVRLGSLGDVIHGIPVAAALRAAYPEARIDWMVDPRYVELLQQVTAITQVVAVDPRAVYRGGGHAVRAMLRELRRTQYDAVIDLQGLLKSALLARLAGGRRTIGFPREHLREPLARWFYSDTPSPGTARHVVHKNLALLAPLGIDAPEVRFPFAERGGQGTAGRTQDTGHRTQNTGHRTQDTGHRTQEETGDRRQETGDRIGDAGHRSRDAGHRTQDTGHGTQDTGHGTQDTGHRTQNTGDGRQETGHRTQNQNRAEDTQGHGTQNAEGGAYVLINPGAAWPNKRWPAERFGAVAAAIRERFGMRSIVLWGPGEQALAGAVVTASRGAAAMSPPTRIIDLLSLARAARLVISGDTGPLHIACAVGTPVVALFGPTYADRNGPWLADDEVVSRTGACVCHYERRCRKAIPCIDDITVAEVMEAVHRRVGVHGL